MNNINRHFFALMHQNSLMVTNRIKQTTYLPLRELSCSSSSGTMRRGAREQACDSQHNKPARGESGKRRWPLQMSCDLRPPRGGSPVRRCGPGEGGGRDCERVRGRIGL